MDKNAKILVTGSGGLVGTALLKALRAAGYTNLLTPKFEELDLLDQKATETYFAEQKPEYVFHLAAKVGGIVGNKTYPADFTYENLQINTNVIHSAHVNKVKKLLNFGSVCIYPVMAEVPVREDSLFTGLLEYTNEGYAVAKIAGLMLCKKYKEQYGDNFISAMPCNLYGPNDNFHPTNSHVIPGMMRRFVETKERGEDKMVIWGTGKPTRDFMYSEDEADALIFLMNNYDGLEHINIGPGSETSIREIAEALKEITEFEGELVFDTSKPDGTPRRYVDVQKINDLGWHTTTSIRDGLQKTYDWFMANRTEINNKYK